MIHIKAPRNVTGFSHAGQSYAPGDDGMIHGLPESAAEPARAHGWEVFTDQQLVDLAVAEDAKAERPRLKRGTE